MRCPHFQCRRTGCPQGRSEVVHPTLQGQSPASKAPPGPPAQGRTVPALSEPAWNLEEERRQGWAVWEQYMGAQGTGLAMTKCHLLHVTHPL